MSGGDEDYARLRARKKDRRLLKQLKGNDKVQRMAADEGLIDDEDELLTYRELLILIIPDDAEPISEEMGWVQTRDEDVKDHVLELAGDNMSAHHVINKFSREFVEAHDIEVNND